MHLFELKKISKNPKTSREQWLKFINAYREDFEMVEATSMPIIQKAVKVIYYMSEDTGIRELARMREKALHDEASAIRQAWEEGFVEGAAESLAESLGVTKDAVKEIAKELANDKIRGFKKIRDEGETEERNKMIEKMRAIGCSEELIKVTFPSYS
ncbi:MAG: PD-(D/E)XK nuclease family transposase [Ruminiclostridium sp.]